jgi:hypothetical protein
VTNLQLPDAGEDDAIGSATTKKKYYLIVN